MVESRSLPAALRATARQRPDATAFTYPDYEFDPAGRAETTTWLQLHSRVQGVAAELSATGSPGDRVAVLAPHGLDYIVGVLGRPPDSTTKGWLVVTRRRAKATRRRRLLAQARRIGVHLRWANHRSVAR